MYADLEMSLFGRENLRNSAFQRGMTFFIYSSERNSSAPCGRSYNATMLKRVDLDACAVLVIYSGAYIQRRSFPALLRCLNAQLSKGRRIINWRRLSVKIEKKRRAPQLDTVKLI